MAEKAAASIIITNYNYALFLPAAIESALEQSLPGLEVIVVDDGSTDNSREIIQSYGSQVRALFQENGGQAEAFNAGFAQSQGDLVIFLDADDVLLPGIAERCAEVLRARPETTRIQYRMEEIDAEGKTTGVLKPPGHIPMPTGNLRRQILTFPFDLPWLPTSGNAFSAQYLRQVFPIPAEDYGRAGADYYLVHLAPLFGPVEYLSSVGAFYRVHGANTHQQAADSLDMPHLRQTIAYESITHKWIQAYANPKTPEGGEIRPGQNRSVSHLANCLVFRKLDPSPQTFVQDRVWRLVLKGWRGAFSRFDISLPGRLMFAMWFLAVGAAPRWLATRLAELFFFPRRRQRLNLLIAPMHKQRVEDLQPMEEDPEGVL